MPFLVSAGCLSADEMSRGSELLTEFFGGTVLCYSVEDCPNEVLSALPKEDCLFQLNGDPAKFNIDFGSWLEALGSWRHPTLLMVSPAPSLGDMTGLAAAYVALCKDLAVPLVGIVQLGGQWNFEQRRLDGLPWCGRLPINKEDEDEILKNTDSIYLMDTENVCLNIKKRILTLDV